MRENSVHSTYFYDEFGNVTGEAKTYETKYSSTTYYTDRYGKVKGESKRYK